MSPATAAVPYRRLSAFYFLYFACLGVMVPFWSLYLEEAGLDARAIGVVLAVMACARIVAPNFWGWLADRPGWRLPVIRGGAVLSAVSFAGLLADGGFVWILAAVTLHTFFWNAILAQYEVITLATLGAEVHRYGQVRMWGSISFVLMVMACGALFDLTGIGWFPLVMMAPLVLLAAGSFTIRDVATPPRGKEHAGLPAALRSRALWVFLGASFLMQVSHAPYYGFFSLLLDGRGYSGTTIGWLWALGVVAEVLLFAVAHRLFARFDLRAILLASLLLATLRWLIIGLGSGSLVLLVLAQCLHAATFGSFHSAAIEFVRRHFGTTHQGQGQALYSALSFGAGGALGALGSGWLWEFDQGLVFVLAGASALAGWWLLRAWGPEPAAGAAS